MSTTVNMKLNSINVSASLEASDHSAGDTFWQQNENRGKEKKQKKLVNKGFFEGSVPMVIRGIYADLAGLMNAICLLQTQSAFLNQAKSAIDRLERMTSRTKTNTERNRGIKSELTTFIANALQKTAQINESNLEDKSVDTPPLYTFKPLQAKLLKDNNDWGNLSALIQERLKSLKDQNQHLMGLARSARLRIEEFIHHSEHSEQQDVSNATTRTLNELHSGSFKAFHSQSGRLPNSALGLINN